MIFCENKEGGNNTGCCDDYTIRYVYRARGFGCVLSGGALKNVGCAGIVGDKVRCEHLYVTKKFDHHSLRSGVDSINGCKG